MSLILGLLLGTSQIFVKDQCFNTFINTVAFLLNFVLVHQLHVLITIFPHYLKILNYSFSSVCIE